MISKRLYHAIQIIALMILVYIVCLFFLQSLETKELVNKVVPTTISPRNLMNFPDVPEIQGYYNANSKTRSNGRPKQWWRCIGGVKAFTQRILNLEMEIVENVHEITFTQENYQILYYIKSCLKGMQKLLTYEPISVVPQKLEVWQDFANGINGFLDVDVTYDDRGIVQATTLTLEFTDNEATELEISLNNFQNAKKSTIYIITPVYKRKHLFVGFGYNVKSLLIRETANNKKANFGWCVVDFEGDDLEVKEEIKQFGLNDIDLKIVQMKLPFKKTIALQSCINLLKEDDIVFVVDVDVRFPVDILDRVRRYVVKGKRFYSPIVHYNNIGEDGKDYSGEPDQYFGWAIEGTGMIALYKHDITRFGGYDVETFGEYHGFEDTDFFFSARYLKLQVARRKEIGFVHIPHERTANTGWDYQLRRKDLVECPED